MIPFTAFYGMHMNPFDKGLSSKDAYRTPDLEQMQGRTIPVSACLLPHPDRARLSPCAVSLTT